MIGLGHGARRVLRQNDAGGHDVLIEAAVLRRVDHIGSAAQHSSGEAAGAERTLEGFAVDALGHAGHQQRSLLAELIAQLGGGADAIGRAGAGAHHGDGHLVVEHGQRALAVQQYRRVEDGAEPVGVETVAHGEDELPVPGAVRQHLLGALQRLVRQQRRLRLGDVRCQQQLALVGVVDVLRGVEVLQQLEAGAGAKAGQCGQPDPVFQCGHVSCPPRRGTPPTAARRRLRRRSAIHSGASWECAASRGTAPASRHGRPVPRCR